MLIVYYRTYTVQEFFDGQNHFYRYLSNSGTWTDWHETALDFPSFYKNYASLSALAEGEGIIRYHIDIGSSLTIAGYCMIYVDVNGGEDAGFYLNCYAKTVEVSPLTTATVTVSHSSNQVTKITAISKYANAVVIRLNI